MATVLGAHARSRSDDRFFFFGAIAMVAVIVFGFSLQLSLGRSSFAVPAVIHVHAGVFFGWVVLYLAQNTLVATANLPLHRRLGWLAVAWVPVMMVMGTIMTIVSLKHGGGPFFFDQNEFLFGNPIVLYAFGGLAFWAIGVRRNTGWHRRLMFCGMAILTGPGFGRFLPLPFAIPWAWWATFAAVLLFPLAGVVADLRRSGRVHPAWWAGIGVMTAAMILADLVAYSPLGVSLTHRVVDGTAGATRPFHAYRPWAAHVP